VQGLPLAGARTAGALASASTTASGAGATTAGVPASASTTASGANAKTAAGTRNADALASDAAAQPCLKLACGLATFIHIRTHVYIHTHTSVVGAKVVASVVVQEVACRRRKAPTSSCDFVTL